MIKPKSNIFKKFVPPQSEFSHRYACWANNHNGWSKQKKDNKRIAKRKFKRFMRKDDDNA